MSQTSTSLHRHGAHVASCINMTCSSEKKGRASAEANIGTPPANFTVHEVTVPLVNGALTKGKCGSAPLARCLSSPSPAHHTYQPALLLHHCLPKSGPPFPLLGYRIFLTRIFYTYREKRAS